MEKTSGAAESVSREPVSVAHALFLPATFDDNNPDTERAWATEAMQPAEDGYKVILSADPQFLKHQSRQPHLF